MRLHSAAPSAPPWRALWLPAASSAGAALALTYAVLATSPTADRVAPSASTPERAAQDFVDAHQRRDWDAAARLATGGLRRSLETRARSARLQGVRARSGRRRLEIHESFSVDADRLRFAGELVSDRLPEERGWPISITIGRHGERHLAEALTWPKGVPPDELR